MLFLRSDVSPSALLSAPRAQALDLAPLPRSVEAGGFGYAGYGYGYPGYPGPYPGYQYYPGYNYDRYPEDDYDYEAEDKAAHDAYVADYYARVGPGPTVEDNYNYPNYPYPYPYSGDYPYGGYGGWPDIETNYEIRGGYPPTISDLKSVAPGQQLSWENVGYDPQYGKNLHWDTLPHDAWIGPTSGDYQGPNPSVMWARKGRKGQSQQQQQEGGRAGVAQLAQRQQKLKPAYGSDGARTTILRPGFFSSDPDPLMGEPGGRPEPTEEELPRCPCAGVGGMCLDLLRDEIHDQGPTPCFCNC